MRKRILFRCRFDPKAMALDEKVRYCMMAVGAAGFLLATMGLHVSPFDPMSGAGS